MDEKFVNKCFENWKAIVEYIEKQYENLPVSRDFALDFVTKPNERTIIFELTVNTFGAVYLKSNDKEDYSDFLNIFKLDDVTKAKCTDMRKKETISIFCHCIETICKDWDKIKEAITKSQEGYHAVMNFSVGRGSEIQRFNFHFDIGTRSSQLQELTVPDLTLKEAKVIAEGICEGLKFKYKTPAVWVSIEGESETLFKIS
ncbi:MAG: hypothetical protein Q4D64_06020 [Prevotellaceae bacterium]|nr:hypothetical protein [Prevotellaceae bacterium]